MNTVDFFRALGDDTRQTILQILQDVEELSVNDLCEQLPRLTQPTISHHLHVLRQCRLVEMRKVGRQVFYQLNRVTLHVAGNAFYLEWHLERE